MICLRIGDGSGSRIDDNLHWIEREIINIVGSKPESVMVERLLDYNGAVRRVTTLRPTEEQKILKLTQEKWVSKGQWVEVNNGDVECTNPQRLLKLENIWADHFNL